MRTIRIALASLSLVHSVASLAPAPLSALDFVVTRYDDSFLNGCDPGDCSLREATLAANANPGLDRILLSAGTYKLTRFGPDDEGIEGDLDLNDDVEILGVAANLTTIDAAPLGTAAQEPAISVRVGSTTLRDLRITGSQVTGLRVFANLTMERCEVANNDFQGNDAGVRGTGGGTMVIRDSAIINNGSGLQATGGDVEMENVTFNSNGQNQIIVQNSALLTCRHCTVVEQVGGNPEVIASGGALAIFANSIVSGVCEMQSGGAVGSIDGGNVESPGHSCLFALASDRDDVADPGLTALGDHGGATRTFDLLANSPAVSLVDSDECSAHDQRGVARSFHSVTPCDAGAVERVTSRVATPIFADGFEQGDDEAWSGTSG